MASLRDLVVNALGGPERAAEIWAAVKQEPGRIAQGIGSAVSLPGDVYSGRQQINDLASGMPGKDVIGRAASLAGLVSQGGVGFEAAGSNVVLRGTRAPVNESVAGGFNKNYRMILDGRDAGGLSVNNEDPLNLWVNYVGRSGTANSVGPKGMRGILQELQRTYPDAASLSGYRFSGARARAGAATDATVPMPGIEAVGSRPAPSSSLRDLVMQGAAASGVTTRPPIDPATGAPPGWQVY